MSDACLGKSRQYDALVVCSVGCFSLILSTLLVVVVFTNNFIAWHSKSRQVLVDKNCSILCASSNILDKVVVFYPFVFVFVPAGAQAHIEAQSSWVTALSWVQTSTPFLSQEACSQVSPPESLLVGRLDGSLCWLEVTDDFRVERTELTHCYRKEGWSLNVLKISVLMCVH